MNQCQEQDNDRRDDNQMVHCSHDRLSIIFLVHSLVGGGAEKVIVNLANHFCAQGHGVTLVTTRRGVYFDQLSEGVFTRFLYFQKRLFPANIFQLAFLLWRTKPDVLMSTLMLSNILGPFARRIAGVPTKVILLEQNTLHRYRPRPSSMRSRVSLALMRRAYPLADAIVANSPDTASDLVEFNVVRAESLSIIPNPVWDDILTDRAGECSAQPAIEGTRPYLLSVGRLHKQKDFATLILAVKQVQSSHDMRIIILGSGPEEEPLRQLIVDLDAQHLVTLAGFKENPYPYYKRASAFCLTSRWEGFGNVLVEALGFGLPIVCTDCAGGPRMILDNGRYGALVPVGDVTAISKAITDILDNRNAYPKEVQVERARQFSIAHIAGQYESLTRKLISSTAATTY